MKTFKYEGQNASGGRVTGIVEAFDATDAANRAREYCRVLLRVEPVRNSRMDRILHADIGQLLSGGKIKPKKLALVCSQLSIELRAGLPLVNSLRLVAENEEDKAVKAILLGTASDVQAGKRLTSALAANGPTLPKSFIETVRAGEEAGNLDQSFERLQNYYENQSAVASKVSSAMIYPAMLIAVAVVVVLVIMLVAVPVFEESFSAMGNTLPGPTRALIAMSNFMTDNILLLLAIVVLLVTAVIFYARSEGGRHALARLALTFPGIGEVNRMSAASQFSATLSTMLAAGLPLLQATRITSAVLKNAILRDEIEEAARGILEGRMLGHGLKKSRYMPKLLLEMVSVGEQTGHIEQTLEVVTEYYTKEVDASVKRALGVLEPVITMVLAGIVVFILLAVYLPIFGMYGSM